MIHFGEGPPVRLAARWYATWERGLENSHLELEHHHIYNVWAIAFRRDDKLHLIEMLDDGMQGL